MEEKPYKVKTGSGRMEVSALVKGKPHSVSVPYPLSIMVNGERVKLTRKATISYCLERLQKNA